MPADWGRDDPRKEIAPAVLLGRRGDPGHKGIAERSPFGGPDRGLRGGVGAGGARPLGAPLAEEEAGASRPRSRRARAVGAEEPLGASKSGEGLELSSLPFRASCPHCQETFVVPRTAEGAAAPPPSEEPESHAGCAGTRGRPPRPVPPALPRRLPGADSPGFSAALASCSRGPGPFRDLFLSPSPRRGQ